MIKKLAILGQKDIKKYSLSPIIHTVFLKNTKINGEYNAISVLPEELFEKLKELQKENYTGVNLTIPHKINVLKYLNKLDKTAKNIGAVNTILFKENGDMVGYNTDCFGFIENINKKYENWKQTNNKVIIFGAGGASRAIVYALKNNGINDVVICNRTFEKAVELANEFNFIAVKWEEKKIEDRNLLINTTSAGMNESPSLNIDLKDADKNSIVYDIVYSPLITPFLKQALELNLKIVNGLGMLLYQAIGAFEIWFNNKPEISEELYKNLKKICKCHTL
jgi:shikimate dehydrogenase